MDHRKLSNGIKNTLRADVSFNAFEGKVVASNDFLDQVEGRTRCPNCMKSRKFFCYTCYIPMPSIESRLPKINVGHCCEFPICQTSSPALIELMKMIFCVSMIVVHTSGSDQAPPGARRKKYSSTRSRCRSRSCQDIHLSRSP
jgi:hypothetical protein